jgi:hypothetical protein
MKRRKLLVSCVVFLLLLALGVFFALRPGFPAETYEAAMTADDAGDEAKSRELFKEACDEGSDSACKALNEQVVLNQARKP